MRYPLRTPRRSAAATAVIALLLVARTGSAEARRRPDPDVPARSGLLLRATAQGGGSGIVRSEPWLSSWEPVGISFCLVHEPSSPEVDYSGAEPLPAALDSTNVIGCERSSPAGPATSYFTAANSEHFEALADRLTDGADGMIWDLAFLVDARGIPFGLGGSGCPETCDRAGWKTPSVEKHQPDEVPDLAGFIDRLHPARCQPLQLVDRTPRPTVLLSIGLRRLRASP